MENVNKLSCPNESAGDTNVTTGLRSLNNKSGIVTGLIFTGIGAVGLGAGFLTGFSRAKKRLKGDIALTSTVELEREGTLLARRALAYGSLASVCAVGSLIAIGAYILDIGSIRDLKEISRVAALEANSKK